ncbi:putative leucine-rich repeat receptor-like protein kinase At2g19210 [Typha latifolia]|uniref:putative leucine-rich repeat receptor-like protein kinase At2g19210 n=1 Tax=Typha latifolia TaxID=4733 RepID=UPI003C2BB374
MVKLWLTMISILGVSLAALAQENPQGFKSIDCGLPDGQSYIDKNIKLRYISDWQFVESGTTRIIQKSSIDQNLGQRYQTLRSFPNGTRNCYTIKDLVQGEKYLVRATFLYGNYDGLNSASSAFEFDLYLDYKLWQRIKISANTDGYDRAEVVTIIPTSILWVCLVNIGKGVPFINVLELRQLKTSMYPAVNTSVSLVLENERYNLGANRERIRYPDDPYDRMWWWDMTNPKWTNISTSLAIAGDAESIFEVPSAVLRTAVMSSRIDIHFDVNDEGDKEKFIAMHFVEFNDTESRTFDFLLNDRLWYRSYTPPRLRVDYIYTGETVAMVNYTFSLVQALNSTLPPILNAVEVYKVMRVSDLPTNNQDVDGIMGIKEQYKVKRNWMGDPCTPKSFVWDGATCTYNTSDYARVVALNLSSFGLTGEISASFVNLASLKSLDLSLNSLTGPLPDFLVNLTSLEHLNLTGNQLSGSVPPALLRRSQDGSLRLSIEDNPKLCVNGSTCGNNDPDLCADGSTCGKKKTTLIIVVIIAVVVVVLLIVGFIIWRLKRPAFSTSSSKKLSEDDSNKLIDDQGNLLQIDLRRFTYLELEKITNNFELVIGQGGFGTVYRACLENASQVAVKMLSHSSRQGAKEFLAEVKNLSKVYHRNLLSLVGYCKDGNHLALVYDYMSEGSLDDHLRGKACTDRVLMWEDRLRIVYEAAQGLEYLHGSCDPPIIHRDVKTANILLNQKLEAKIADFGLARDFKSDFHTNASSGVAGTPGYLDPEYISTHNFDKKSDVYSFGVVLLVVITSKPQILRTPGTVHLTQWVAQRLAKGIIDDVIDKRLQEQYDVNSVWKVIDLALACTEKTSTERPSMSYVVAQLKESLSLVAACDSSRNLGMDSNILSQISASGISHASNGEDFTGPSIR